MSATAHCGNRVQLAFLVFNEDGVASGDRPPNPTPTYKGPAQRARAVARKENPMRVAITSCIAALVAAFVGAAGSHPATAATTPSVRAAIGGDVFCIAAGGVPCSGSSFDLERFGSQDNDVDGDGVASSSFTGSYSSAQSAVNVPAGRLRASGSGSLPTVPAGGAGSLQVSGSAQIADSITLLSPARLTLRGFVDWSGTVATHVVVSRFERQGSGECCEVTFGELDAGPNAPDPRGAFSIPLDLPAGTFDFTAEVLGSVDKRAEEGQSASGSFDGALDFAIDVPAGTVATSGSGRLPLVGGSPPPPQGNTPAGDNVQVGPLQGVTFTFSHVTSPGETSVTSLSSGPRPPLGYEVLGAYFELATTAAFDSAEVCFPYTGTPAPSIVHFLEGAQPVVLATSRDTGAEVCAVVTSFSPFVLVRPAGDTTAPTLSLPGNLTVNATLPTGTAVTYAASASDNVDPSPGLSCSPASGSTFAIGQTTVTCTATDASGNSSSGSFTVTVKGAKEQLADLIQKVVNASQLSPAAKTLLISKLNQLLASFDPSNATQRQAVCLALQVFKAAAQLQAGKTITQAQATEWIADANRIRTVLGC
jgi:hypothetical protein